VNLPVFNNLECSVVMFKSGTCVPLWNNIGKVIATSELESTTGKDHEIVCSVPEQSPVTHPHGPDRKILTTYSFN